MDTLTYGDLRVSVHNSNAELGVAGAALFAEAVREELTKREELAVILATGNSQLSFVAALRERDDIEWSRVSVLHMDEYIGMSETHSASFRLWMQHNIVEPFGPKAFYGVRGDHEPVQEEVDRYAALLRDLEPAICVMGIGENGHLAFNDPPADFETDELVHVIAMDKASRQQQVGEGHFPSLDEAPTHAISLTIPALLAPHHVLVMTPEKRKARAVAEALQGEITPQLPASILRTQPQARLLLDRDSASGLQALVR
ncbi:MAG: 6-phosphogluconolactonase [Microbacterium sp.]